MAFDLAGFGQIFSSATNLVGSGLQFGAAKKGAQAAQQSAYYNFLAFQQAGKTTAESEKLKYDSFQKIAIWGFIAIIIIVLLYLFLK
jgi:hypothetical protein